MTTDINAILLGLEAKWKMLKTCHGLEEKNKRPDGDDLKDFAKTHNSLRNNKRGRSR